MTSTTPPPHPLIDPPNPNRRTWRTVLQAGVGILLGIPLAIGPLGLPPDVAAKVAAVTGALAALASLVQNQWDKAHGRG